MNASAESPQRGRTGGVAVVGSANVDVVVPVERHPRVGETVIGGDHWRAAGGKGANQAIACARLGAATRFVGRVGDDDPGRLLREALIHDGVDVTGLLDTPAAPSGLALVVVGPDGDNAIVVSPGANARLAPADLEGCGIEPAAALLVQLETPVDTVTAAAARSRGLVVLNPAPATTLPEALLDRADVVVPNRSELAVLSRADRPPQDAAEAGELAQALPAAGRVVVTLGAEGAVVVEGQQITPVPAHPVAVRDATGAGDAFCAALTVALLGGADLVAAARWACCAAALATTRRGAQASLPTRAEVEALAATVPRSR